MHTPRRCTYELRIIDTSCIAVMADGRVIENGPPQALLSDPTSEFGKLARSTGDDGLSRLQELSRAAVRVEEQPVLLGGRLC